jgi:hypothetical protein
VRSGQGSRQVDDENAVQWSTHAVILAYDRWEMRSVHGLTDRRGAPASRRTA